MLGVFLATTQMSASMLSIVQVALSISPRNIPACTRTSVTANPTPDTVIRKRSLSWKRILRARSTMGAFLSDLRDGGLVTARADDALRVERVLDPRGQRPEAGRAAGELVDG